MNKKLQVFVSSTYTDLIEERQTAVQAILDAGHIPAGMELFKAGNESQLNTIYKWINESDVYMLILGGRYGSIETNSGKSYTQLEYEYALSKNIPVFAVVISNSYLTQKINSMGYDKVTEQDHPDKYKSFKEFVMSKIIREVSDNKDIQIAIHTTLNEFINEYDLTGWIRNSNENDTIQLLKDNTNLLKENNLLNKQIQKLQEQLNTKSKEQYGKYTFDELVDTLKNKHFPLFPDAIFSESISALKYFTSHYNEFCSAGGHNGYHGITSFYACCKFLEALNLIEEKSKTVENGFANEPYTYYFFKISKQGTIFMMLLEKSDVKYT